MAISTTMIDANICGAVVGLFTIVGIATGGAIGIMTLWLVGSVKRS